MTTSDGSARGYLSTRHQSGEPSAARPRSGGATGPGLYTPRAPVSPSPQALRMLVAPSSLLIGRQKQFARLWDQFEMSARGFASVALLVGEPGIGKTRLLAEFAKQAAREGALVLRGGASEAEGMPPYLPFLEALGPYLSTAPLTQLREETADIALQLASLFPDVSFRLGELADEVPLPVEQARLRLYDAIGTLLASIAARQPLLLVLDDLQWADTASLGLLYHVIRRQPEAPLLIAGAYREGATEYNAALAHKVNELNRLRRLIMVGISPLTVPDIALLAASKLERPLSQAASQLLWSQSEGNPFFAEELLLGWAEAGDLAAGNPRQLLARLESRLPSGIVSAIRQRLTRLPSEVVDLLRVAAIIGRIFDTPLLATVQGQTMESVEAGLREACQARLVHPYRDSTFIFSHDKIRDCLYTEVSTTRRRQLHERIGLVLEAHPQQDTVHQRATLAFHFARSDDRARGAHYSLLAAEQAHLLPAPVEAMAHYDTALKLLDPHDHRCGDLWLKLGEIALLVGAESKAVASYTAAEAWWLKAGAPLIAARAAHGRALAWWQLGQLPEAQTALHAALCLLDDRADPETVTVLVDLATLIGIDLGCRPDGQVYGHQALELAHQLGDIGLEAAAERTIGNLLVHDNDLKAGVDLLVQALAHATTANHPKETARCCANLAQAYFWLTRIAESRDVSQRRQAVAQNSYDPTPLCYVSTWLAFLDACQGMWTDAARRLDRAQIHAEQLESAEPSAFLHQIRGFLAYQQGHYLVAEREFQEALATFRAQDPRELALCLGMLGLTLLATGQQQATAECTIELEALLTQLEADSPLSGGSLAVGTITSCLALIALHGGDQERSARYYLALLPFQGQHHWFLIDRILGQLATHRGDWQAAQNHLLVAEMAAQREGLLPELARTLVGQATLEVARGGPDSTNRASSHLDQALKLFEQLGLEAEANQARDQCHLVPSQPKSIIPPVSIAGLTERELEVLRLVAAGKSNRQVAEELFLSEKTVANHLTSIFQRTNTSNRAGAVNFAHRNRII